MSESEDSLLVKVPWPALALPKNCVDPPPALVTVPALLVNIAVPAVALLRKKICPPLMLAVEEPVVAKFSAAAALSVMPEADDRERGCRAGRNGECACARIENNAADFNVGCMQNAGGIAGRKGGNIAWTIGRPARGPVVRVVPMICSWIRQPGRASSLSSLGTE